MINEVPWLTISLSLSYLGAIIAGLKIGARKHLPYISLLFLLFPGLILLVLIFSKSFSEPIYDEPFLSAGGLGSFSFVADSVSAPIAITISVVTGLIGFYSYKYMVMRLEEMNATDIDGELAKYYVLYMLFSASMIGVALSSNLIEFYMFLEIGLITSFLLIDYYGYGDRRRIALLYLVWTHIGAVSFLMGSLIYGLSADSFDYIVLGKGPLVGWGEGFAAPNVVKWSFYLMLFGLLVKTAVIGLHLWLPYAHAEAPTPVSALLSPLLIGLGPFAIIRFMIPLFPSSFHNIQLFIILLALLTMIYGGFTALYEKDVKRFLAYSSISQMGYLLLGAATLTPVGIVGLIMHYVAHAFSKAMLFGSAGSLIYHFHGERNIDRLCGVANVLPITAGVSLLGFLGITGIPPTLGFWGEILIIKGLIDASFSSLGHSLVLILLAFLGFSLSLGYSFNTFRKVFFGGYNKTEALIEDKTLLIPLVIMGALLIILFLIAPELSSVAVGYVGGWLR